MKTGPRTGSGSASNGDHRTFVEKAAAAWGETPDWIAELAAIADQLGQKKAADMIGYTAAGDMQGVEESVRGALMGLKVECPILGEIGRDHCLQEQKEPFRATSAFRAQIYHACRNGCPNARLKGGKNAE